VPHVGEPCFKGLKHFGDSRLLIFMAGEILNDVIITKMIIYTKLFSHHENHIIPCHYSNETPNTNV